MHVICMLHVCNMCLARLCSQELLIEEMAVRAFQVTHAEQRDTVSYGDVGTLRVGGLSDG